ncbi:prephenate dehydrogenase [Coprinellus micaceus]|uniref:Prephenate dehydrogenase n=1 Tax=Coprinellus micaceus TaxID=71717 RepID=A0A4Y7SYP5_COPMI|nr:prephenate dehydrogenase [Coprinellus micaceus]
MHSPQNAPTGDLSPNSRDINASKSINKDASLPINVSPDVTPDSPAEEQPTIGLIGMGAMGRMYARAFADAGWKKIHVCDLPEKYESLKREYADSPTITPFPDGHGVSRSSDFIIYSVEAEYIDRVVAQYGPSTKLHAIVAGQTSVKAPERKAFESYLPPDVHIVSVHSLHGPSVSSVEQPLVLINHRGTADALKLVRGILACLKSRYVEMSYEEHDSVTANTQAVTHAAFLSMGTAWSCSAAYPWEQGLYVGGIETVKVNLTLRIYSNAWHVYAGLAILNPSAQTQIAQYSRSATELFKLMLRGGAGDGEAKEELRRRVEWAKEEVFGPFTGNTKEGERRRRPILLSAEVLDKFSLGKPRTSEGSSTPPSPNDAQTSTAAPSSPPPKYRPNSHLSLLAMVDCWAHLRINPYHHLSVAATPLFRLFLGVAEHLFLAGSSVGGGASSEKAGLGESELDRALRSALEDHWHRPDDLEFVLAARGWSQCVGFASFKLYRRRFEETRTFFEERFEEATKVGGRMVKEVMEWEGRREREEKEAL